MRPESKNTLLSDMDFAIVQLLRHDGRMSNRDLANKLGVSEVTVRKRLKKLRENSVLSIVAVVEPQQLGYNLDVIISIRVDVKYLEDVAEKLTRFPEVRYVAMTSGAYDILCAVLFKDTDDLLNFLLKKLSAFKGIVSTDTTFSLRVLKRTHDWFSVADEGVKRPPEQSDLSLP
jgi:Lrp/AsnC family transcriptional regulator for asnA, asnC and gidA